ncbi:hypothetical protein OG524_36265 (plasmid) [Streptomyces sp. NBC_01520]
MAVLSGAGCSMSATMTIVGDVVYLVDVITGSAATLTSPDGV